MSQHNGHRSGSQLDCRPLVEVVVAGAAAAASLAVVVIVIVVVVVQSLISDEFITTDSNFL